MPVCLLTQKKTGLRYYKVGYGECVVLLHGWGSSAKLMMPVTSGLGKYLCIVPDMYGHGLTPHPEEPLTVACYADSVIKLLESEKVKKATFICHSFGGRIGIYLASHHPKIVDKLVLVDSAGLKPRRGARYYFRRFTYNLCKKLGLNTKKCGSSEYRALDGVNKKTFCNVVSYYQDEQLKDVTCPTLIVWGSRDRVTPRYMARRLSKGIKGAKLSFIKGAGHFSYADKPKIFDKILKDFLRS